MMSTEIPNIRDLQTTLSTMKSANRQRINMNIWEQDIKAVEDALKFIEAMRLVSSIPRPPSGDAA